MKKVLIVTMTTGEGHNALARAFSAQLANENVELKTVQLYYYSERRVAFENKLYLTGCKFFPKTYDFFWNKLVNRDPEKRDKLTIHRTMRKAQKNLLNAINLFSPDVILSVHPYASVALSNLREKIKGIKTVGFVTDYVLCPYWEAAINLDYVVVTAPWLIEDLKGKGFKEEQIKCFGYPVANKFQNKLPKNEVRKELDLIDRFTVLIMNGGNGLGNTKKMLKNILKEHLPINIIVVNGKNQKSKAKIEKYLRKKNIYNVTNLGFVNNVEKLMNASDVIISRSGGGSVSEAICMGLPMILREKAIINEKLNKIIFINQNMAVGMRKITDAGFLVKDLFTNPAKLEEMTTNEEKFFKKNGIVDISNFIIE